jgi:hypothetical protein
MPSNSDSSNDNEDDHDLREVLPGMHRTGPALADFDPTPDEPDPEVWPLAGDKGASTFSGDPDDLIPIFNTYPEPNVRWLTAEQFEYEFGYPADEPEAVVANAALADIAEQRRLRLTLTRLEFFERLARLWNGGAVGPDSVHLLADRVPSWDAVFGDLDQEQLADLRPTVRKHDDDIIDAFGRFGWFEPKQRSHGWVKSTYVARVRARYDIEERARTLINGRDDLPDLRGDPHEGLKHRFGVGCEAIRAHFREYRDVRTYASVGNYTVDLLEHDEGRGDVLGEVLTHHHNTELYRDTYRKLVDLQLPAVLIFDTRATARRVFNHWQDRGVDVPGAPFNSDLNVEWTRKQFQKAADDPECDWLIEELLTLTQVWDRAYGEDPAPGLEHSLSVNW